ncbi:hypothetical protein K435DRAFT_420160 [Dendrothele bispora CBS 962.96]|uniref:Uncharacterized protein n=1 Tax=Dendrothele bispora (strain CBS 962.96) TaxID=1314807 RepID=A0A4S8L619_DENBC|nr:hypothetical protein K435DRAFT_420160 [Dendrothele bispora CBS 962.96]
MQDCVVLSTRLADLFAIQAGSISPARMTMIIWLIITNGYVKDGNYHRSLKLLSVVQYNILLEHRNFNLLPLAQHRPSSTHQHR